MLGSSFGDEGKILVKNICCLGAGYVGGPTMAIIASKCPQIKVTIVDINEEKIKQWNTGDIPIHEPQLKELVIDRLNKNLFFSTNVSRGIEEADMIFISVNTPTKTYGIGKNYGSDLTMVESAAKMIGMFSKNDKIIVEKSTVPCGTSEMILKTIKSNSPIKDLHFEILSNPEFLAEGSAIKDLQFPSRILIGGNLTPIGREAQEKLSIIYETWVPKDKILLMSTSSSELSKLASNAMLAQRISSINSLSALSEKVGGDIRKVSLAIGKDERIGDQFLNPSIGFGGSCFKKDILNLVYISQYHGLNEVAQYWKSVLDINEYQKERFIKMIFSMIGGSLRDKKVAILGYSFKNSTGDTRETPSLDIIFGLYNEMATINIYDPVVSINQIKKEMTMNDMLNRTMIHEDVEECCKDCQAIIICTDWIIFNSLHYKKIYQRMSKPAHIFDGKMMFSDEKRNELEKIGFSFHTIG